MEMWITAGTSVVWVCLMHARFLLGGCFVAVFERGNWFVQAELQSVNSIMHIVCVDIVIFSCNSIDGIVFTLKKNLVLILRELAHMIVSQIQ